MGRSRGGLTSKIHALVDACGLPIKLSLSEGQAYDGHQAMPLFFPPKQSFWRTVPMTRMRQLITSQDAFPNIPPMPNRRRRSAFSKYLYKLRRSNASSISSNISEP